MYKQCFVVIHLLLTTQILTNNNLKNFKNYCKSKYFYIKYIEVYQKIVLYVSPEHLIFNTVFIKTFVRINKSRLLHRLVIGNVIKYIKIIFILFSTSSKIIIGIKSTNTEILLICISC